MCSRDREKRKPNLPFGLEKVRWTWKESKPMESQILTEIDIASKDEIFIYFFTISQFYYQLYLDKAGAGGGEEDGVATVCTCASLPRWKTSQSETPQDPRIYTAPRASCASRPDVWPRLLECVQEDICSFSAKRRSLFTPSDQKKSWIQNKIFVFTLTNAFWLRPCKRVFMQYFLDQEPDVTGAIRHHAKNALSLYFHFQFSEVEWELKDTCTRIEPLIFKLFPQSILYFFCWRLSDYFQWLTFIESLSSIPFSF